MKNDPELRGAVGAYSYLFYKRNDLVYSYIYFWIIKSQ